MGYVHLHLHTKFSLFDGYCEPEDIYKKTCLEKMENFAVTDHHNVFAWFPVLELSRKYEASPIYGIELNVGKNHITALAINEEGLKNLILLNNIGHQKGGARPRITENDLMRFHAGIYLLSGCTKGIVPSFLLNGEKERAKTKIQEYKAVFQNRYAFEIQNFGDEIHKKLAKEFMHLAKETKTPIVPTNDCHYLNRSDYVFHDKYVMAKTKGKIHLKNTQNYLKGQEEMKQVFPSVLLDQSEKIANKMQADFGNYITQQKGDLEIPLSMFYYYDDAEALRKVLYAKQNYRLAEFLYKKMNKEGLTLNDIYSSWDETIRSDVEFALRLRGKLYKVEPDPYYYIKTNYNFPIYKKNKESTISAQVDIFTAQELGFQIYDRRKHKVFIYK